MSLFPFPPESARNNNDLRRLANKYPKYSATYINLHMRPDWAKAKDFFEHTWKEFESLADSDFKTELQKNFAERAWELYLFDALRKNSFDFLPQTPQKANPDFKIDLRSRNLYVEAVIAGKGQAHNEVTTINDRLRNVPAGTVITGGGSIEERNQPKVRRILSALDEKTRKYPGTDVVGGEDFYVIAVSGSEIDGSMSSESLILDAVMGISPNIHFPLRTDGSLGEAYRTTRLQISNAQETNVIDTGVFMDAAYRGVSGVIYFGNDAVNASLQDIPAEEIILVHNPNAEPDKRMDLDVFPNFTQITFSDTHWTRHAPTAS